MGFPSELRRLCPAGLEVGLLMDQFEQDKIQQFELDLGVLVKSMGRPIKIVTEEGTEVTGLLVRVEWDGPKAVVEIPLQPQAVIPPV